MGLQSAKSSISNPPLFTFLEILPADSSGRSGVALSLSDKYHSIFKGHFPGNPVVPGACSLDAVLEGVRRLGVTDQSVTKIRRVKWLCPLLPSSNVTNLTLRVKVTGAHCTAQLLNEEGIVAVEVLLDLPS